MFILKNKHLPHCESGAALLAFMLVIITASSFMLVSKLNANIQIAEGEGETRTALNLAKQALIGYAVTYPDKINSAEGPGYLPCPDTDNDGDAEGSCSSGGNTTTGRLPYETLELEELKDSNGEHLWYVLSNNFRNNPKLTPLNSDTPGQLSVNGTGDIVAVIIAPREPVSGQIRNTGPNNVVNYLENDNADLDLDFVTSATGEFNDRLVVLTRAELMSAVEKRVLGEISQKLNDYKGNYNAFPWLSPFTAPANSAFRAQISTDREGHLSFHWVADPSTNANVNPFSTTVRLNWEINPDTASVLLSPPAVTPTVTQACLEKLACTDAIFPAISSISATVDCTWTNKNSADCTDVTFVQGPVACDFGCGLGTGLCERIYTINFPAYSGSLTTISPAATALRTRDVTLIGGLPEQSTAIQIIDNYRGQLLVDSCATLHSFVNHTGRLSFISGTAGTISTRGIQFDLDVDGLDGLDGKDTNADGDYADTGEFPPDGDYADTGEFPPDGDYTDAGEISPEFPVWFVKNKWHHLVYLAYPASEPISGGAIACVTGTDCLVLNGAGTPDDDKRALAVIAGYALSGLSQDRVNSPDRADYFELGNNTALDKNFELGAGQLPVDFNDQVKVIATAP